MRSMNYRAEYRPRGDKGKVIGASGCGRLRQCQARDQRDFVSELTQWVSKVSRWVRKGQQPETWLPVAAGQQGRQGQHLSDSDGSEPVSLVRGAQALALAPAGGCAAATDDGVLAMVRDFAVHEHAAV